MKTAMIRPYFAVITDSFRAALHSKVLYIILALIVVILLIIAPLHVREQVDWKLSMGQIASPDRLAAQLVADGKSGKQAGIARIWQLLPASLRQELDLIATEDTDPDRVAPSTDRAMARLGTYDQLVSELNRLLKRRDFYDEPAFASKRLVAEARELLGQGVENLTQLQLQRLNRLLLDALLRRNIDRPGATQLDFYYFNWHWSAFTTNTSQSEFAHGLSTLLPTYFDKFVMSIGIFIAILVTASIIPEMLEPGSLNLLLSKPVHRWALLLTKFLGGCAFILLCATVFFVGLWLWLGIQMGVWERSILLSIPIYVFVFALYYSVSVLAGLWFRSPILCITFAILFWAVCFVLGAVYGRLDNRQYNFGPAELAAGGAGEVFYVDILQNPHRWEGDRWVPLLGRSPTPNDQAMAIAAYIEPLDDEIADYPGPVFDSQLGCLLAGSANLQPAIRPSRFQLVSASSSNDWSTLPLGNLPLNTIAIFLSPRLGLLALNDSAQVFQATPYPPPPPDDAADDAADASDNQPAKGNGMKFESLSDNARSQLMGSASISLNPANDEIAFYHQGHLVILSPQNDGKYRERQRVKLGEHENRRMTALVQYRGDQIFVALGNGRFFHVNASRVDDYQVIVPDRRAAVRALVASADGRWAAVVYRNGRLWLYDAAEGSEHRGSRVSSQGDVMAAAFDEQGRLWIGDRFQNVIAHDVGSLQVVQQHRPPGDWLDKLFRFLVRPLYRVFPRPGEFYKLISYISAASDTSYSPEIDLTKSPQDEDPWSPLRNGLVFLTMVLGIACLQFQRQDF